MNALSGSNGAFNGDPGNGFGGVSYIDLTGDRWEISPLLGAELGGTSSVSYEVLSMEESDLSRLCPSKPVGPCGSQEDSELSRMVAVELLRLEEIASRGFGSSFTFP